MDYSQINNLAMALATAVQVGLMSREQASGIFKKVLREEGLVEARKPIETKKEVKK